MTRYNYALVTPRKTYSCRDRQSAEYLYGNRKSATIVKHDRRTGNDTIVRSKTDGIEYLNNINA